MDDHFRIAIVAGDGLQARVVGVVAIVIVDDSDRIGVFGGGDFLALTGKSGGGAFKIKIQAFSGVDDIPLQPEKQKDPYDNEKEA